MTFARRKQLMLELSEVVRGTGQDVMQLREESIRDTVAASGHQYSTVDDEAGNRLRWHIERIMRVFREHEHGEVLEESKIPHGRLSPEDVRYPVLVCDAVEGSTNAKRGLAAVIRRPILAGTSGVILESPVLSSAVASAFYDFASQKVFASVRVERGAFISFADGQVIADECVLEVRGDSQVYAVVPGYSNEDISARAEVEKALRSAGFWTTGGSRSSAQDLVGLLCNDVDAYVDLRALFRCREHRDEVLHFWDVGALLPVLEGLGFTITDARGKGWMQCQFGEPLALIVTRPSLELRIRRVVSELSFLTSVPAEYESASVKLPPARIA